jgi:acetylornithine/succinyldiaminopimelate/putrescine aminotransferase
MILDEVQVAMGRTGTLFAYEQCNVKPDIVTLAKAVGNGFPVGVMMATNSVAAAFQPGNHASTFGGNPLAMAASLATLNTIMNEGVLDNVKKMGSYFMKRLHELKKKCPLIKEIRGRGLIIGVELTVEGANIVKECMERGLLINCTGGNVLRFVPPLIITEADVDCAVEILGKVLVAP